jgi:hypothetical protein
MEYIYSIIIGYNNEASINDAIMMENLLLKLQKNNNKILDPFLYTNKENIVNLRSLIDHINKTNDNHTILLYYSGHGYNDSIDYYKLNGNQINSLLETGKRNEFNKIVILDCCYANSINIPLKNSLIISSCERNQLSSESLSEILLSNNNNKQYLHSTTFLKNSSLYYNFQIGIFTYNLCNLIENNTISTKIFNNSIWNTIEYISNQKICVKGNINLFNILYK